MIEKIKKRLPRFQRITLGQRITWIALSTAILLYSKANDFQGTAGFFWLGIMGGVLVVDVVMIATIFSEIKRMRGD